MRHSAGRGQLWAMAHWWQQDAEDGRGSVGPTGCGTTEEDGLRAGLRRSKQNGRAHEIENRQGCFLSFACGAAWRRSGPSLAAARGAGHIGGPQLRAQGSGSGLRASCRRPCSGRAAAPGRAAAAAGGHRRRCHSPPPSCRPPLCGQGTARACTASGSSRGQRGLPRWQRAAEEGREGVCSSSSSSRGASVSISCVLLLDGSRRAGRQIARRRGRQTGRPAGRPTFVKWSTSWPTRPRPPKSQASESSTTRYLPGSGTGTCRQGRAGGRVGGRVAHACVGMSGERGPVAGQGRQRRRRKGGARAARMQPPSQAVAGAPARYSACSRRACRLACTQGWLAGWQAVCMQSCMQGWQGGAPAGPHSL